MKLFPYTPEGFEQAKAWLITQGKPLVVSTNATGIQWISIQRSKRQPKAPPRKDVLFSYNARYMVAGKSYTKNFPYTQEGLEAATAWVTTQRQRHMDFATV
jgi:hypothetical protein